MRTRSGLLLLPGGTLLLLGFLLPTVAMLIAPPDAGPADVFARLGEMLQDPVLLTVVTRTVSVALITTVICLVLGFPIAHLIASSPSRWAGVLLALAIFPLLLSNVVRTFGWLVVLGRNGVIGQIIVALGLAPEAPQLLYTRLAIVLGLVQLFLPLAIIPCYSAVAQLDPGLEDAARGLGASRLRTFWTITVPLALPGVVVAATLVFAGSVTAYTTPYLLGGSRERVLSTQLFSYASDSLDWASASATAVIMTVIVLVAAAVSSLLGRRGSTA